jgi:hypothetical protein
MPALAVRPHLALKLTIRVFAHPVSCLSSARRGDTAFLLATDVAARGLDIQGVEVRPWRALYGRVHRAYNP